MGKVIAGVVVGYLAMFFVVFVALTLAWLAMGVDGAFQAGSFEPSTTWAIVSIVVGLIAAYIGGWVAVKLGGKPAAMWLIGVVVVLGLVIAIPALTAAPATEARPSELPMMEAMAKARTPVWLALLNPVLAAVGVWLAIRGGGDGAKATP